MYNMGRRHACAKRHVRVRQRQQARGIRSDIAVPASAPMRVRACGQEGTRREEGGGARYRA